MVERPTARWREQVAEEKAGLASGALDPDDAFAVELWPEPMIQETDEVLECFDIAVADLVEHRFEAAPDAEIFEVIRRVENVLDEAGIDVDALAARHRGQRLMLSRSS
ncbi:hypothetical protein [Virgisporangium aurantiacum]|uniref:Uncharacterized protein n=1 Tax=Virgisporangium aurantiacum TaxID=175570 RepID=A0A8J3ZLB0_9ACTN|nr:hypothetical protein [Virgisporangium aurantiacum]GIJ63515.1 hypothetical protein Vau01_110310 [Virgisporangium aurantiacum]